jgi:hypothetical protein
VTLYRTGKPAKAKMPLAWPAPCTLWRGAGQKFLNRRWCTEASRLLKTECYASPIDQQTGQNRAHDQAARGHKKSEEGRAQITLPTAQRTRYSFLGGADFSPSRVKLCNSPSGLALIAYRMSFPIRQCSSEGSFPLTLSV